MLWVIRGDDRRFWGILVGRFRRRIDPNRVRQDFEARRALYEALGMRGVGSLARAVPALKGRGGAPVVDIGRREIAEAAVMMRIVVPREEIAGNAMLVSGNSFDVIGAKSVGLRAAWLRRSDTAVLDPWGVDPDVTVRDLTELAVLSRGP
jgi:hypothetical protein